MTYHTHVICMRNIAGPGEVVPPRVSLNSRLQLSKGDESRSLTDIRLQHLQRRYLGCSLCRFVLLAEEILNGLFIGHVRRCLCPQERHYGQVTVNFFLKEIDAWELGDARGEEMVCEVERKQTEEVNFC